MPIQIETALLAELRERLRSARRVFVLTGAGVSAESGVPTFRGGGQTAVWKGMPFEVISSAGMLARDLPAVWEWFDYRRKLLCELQPNPAHRTLALWQDKFENFRLATQNIDGLHAAAGSRNVLELHGNIWTARCTECGARASLRDMDERERPPVCRDCCNAMRPDVVLFGEMLPAGVFERAAADARRAASNGHGRPLLEVTGLKTQFFTQDGVVRAKRVEDSPGDQPEVEDVLDDLEKALQ